MSDTREEMHRACITQPEEDTPRLVLADWYEENDRPDLAAALRERGYWRVNADGLLAWVDYWRSELAVFGLWPWPTEPLPSCAHCRLNGEIDLRPNPYREEICNEILWEWCCADCRQNLLDDI